MGNDSSGQEEEEKEEIIPKKKKKLDIEQKSEDSDEPKIATNLEIKDMKTFLTSPCPKGIIL